MEAAEDFLLDPDTIPTLKQATILLEIHHWVRPELREELLARMVATHTVRMASTRPRTIADLPIQPPLLMRLFRRKALRMLLEENCGAPMEWALFEPRRFTVDAAVHSRLDLFHGRDPAFAQSAQGGTASLPFSRHR